ncbi:hypothetical protein BH11MYX1_BH11MYX1_01910 [soil metagenome]
MTALALVGDTLLVATDEGSIAVYAWRSPNSNMVPA